MMPLAAYADRLSVRPGETIRFQVANATGSGISSSLARVICADANPAGPGVQVESVNSSVTMLREPAPATVPIGSYARIDGLDEWFEGDSFTFACRIFPTRISANPQAIMSRLDDGANGIALMLAADGRLRGFMGGAHVLEGPRVETALADRRWYLVWLRFMRMRALCKRA